MIKGYTLYKAQVLCTVSESCPGATSIRKIHVAIDYTMNFKDARTRIKEVIHQILEGEYALTTVLNIKAVELDGAETEIWVEHD